MYLRLAYCLPLAIRLLEINVGLMKLSRLFNGRSKNWTQNITKRRIARRQQRWNSQRYLMVSRVYHSFPVLPFEQADAFCSAFWCIFRNVQTTLHPCECVSSIRTYLQRRAGRHRTRRYHASRAQHNHIGCFHSRAYINITLEKRTTSTRCDEVPDH